LLFPASNSRSVCKVSIDGPLEVIDKLFFVKAATGVTPSNYDPIPLKTPQHTVIVSKNKKLDFYIYMLYSPCKDNDHVGAIAVAHQKTLGV
jgi:hypothetical protein